MFKRIFTATILWIFRALRSFERGIQACLFPFLCRWYSKEEKDSFNRKLYSKEETYRPEGGTSRSGLFPWETNFLSVYDIGEGKNILLPACGGGREIFAFLKRGLEVCAFDFSKDLVEQAQSALKNASGVTLQQSSLEVLVDSESWIWDEGPFDALFFGWGSTSYFDSFETLEKALTCFRDRNPQSPVLLSFMTPNTFHGGRAEQWGQKLGDCLAHFFHLSELKRGESFFPELGFHLQYTPEDIKEISRRAGYKVERGDISPFPHALLSPEPRS